MEEVHDFLLDEWANAFQFGPIEEADEIGLGTYYIHEEDAPISNLSKESSDMHGLWDMFFDGSRNKNGAATDVLLISPRGEKYYFSFKLHLCCTNNVAKYEALILGL